MTETSRVALVTGAARGIGRAIACALARPGLILYLNDVVIDAEAEAARNEVAAQGADARLLQFNVADTAAVQAGIDKIMSESGRLDLLVNNAGITRDNLVMRMKEEDWDRVLEVNLKGAFNCIGPRPNTWLSSGAGASSTSPPWWGRWATRGRPITWLPKPASSG